MKNENTKLIDKRFEKIIEDKAYKSIYAQKLQEIFLKYGNILSKKSIDEFDEFVGNNNTKQINVLIWETDKVYKDEKTTLFDVWVNEEYEGFPQIIPMSDIETYCAKTDCPYKTVASHLAKKGYRKYSKDNPYISHSSRIHFFKSLVMASEWVAEDIHKKIKTYDVDINVVKSKLSEIINTTDDSKTKRYKYKGYIAKKI